MRQTSKSIFTKKKHREKITVLTAYDFPFAGILDQCGIDIILVGDSLGMVVLGHKNTLPVTMENMAHHTAAASRAVKNALVVADMPYRSYRTPAEAVKNAKLLKKAGAQAVKLEGGRAVAKQVAAILKAGIPVMGHAGMLPQSVEKLGGYKVQGKDAAGAKKVLEDAQALDRLGVFAMVLECVPAALAERISKTVKCPTIGIGAGAGTDGQVLVLHDMLGFESSVRPRFVRQYAGLAEETKAAVTQYIEDVRSGKFPSKEESY
jgi:3-methyl-2-oxobutanoate hydroxymethyltransferase